MQIELERELAARGYRYLRKRGEQDPSAPLAFMKRRVKKEEIAVAVAGALWESVPLRVGQSPLFDPEEPYYDEIFRNRSPDHMLACYWLWRTVTSTARGSSDRQAAKFLVHFQVYQQTKHVVSRNARRFVESAEVKDGAVLDPLTSAVDALFRIALAAYRKNRSLDGQRVSIRPYHQRQDVGVLANLGKELKAKSRWKDRYQRELKAFETALVDK
jgi:hypothetical protein